METEVYHLGAIFNGLFSVEGTILPSDALADDTSVLVNEDGGRWWRRRRVVADLRQGRRRGFARCKRSDQLGDGLATHRRCCDSPSMTNTFRPVTQLPLENEDYYF